MADPDWVYEPPARRFGPGEAIAEPGGDEQLMLPPGEMAQRDLNQSMLDAIRSGANTATFGLDDRAVAALRALTGERPSYGQAAEEELGKTEAARNRSPMATIAGDIIGGGVTGGGLAASGATLAPRLSNRFGRALMSGVEGGLFSGAQGAGQTHTGNPGDYFSAALANAAPGGVLGLVGAPLAGRAAGGIDRARTTYSRIPPALAEAAQADRPGLEEIARGARGPRAMLPDAGPTMLGVGQGAAIDVTNPNVGALREALQRRTESSNPYINQQLDQIFGPMTTPATLQRTQVQPRIDALSPHYDAALAQAHAVDTSGIANFIDGRLPNLVGEPAERLAQIRSQLDLRGTPGTLDPYPPKLQAIRSNIKAQLRQNDATPGGTMQDNTAGLLRELDRQMTAELQAKVPGLKRLDDLRAEYGTQEEALGPRSIGSRIFDKGKTEILPEDFRYALNEAAQPKGNLPRTFEPQYLSAAARVQLQRIVGDNRNDLNALERIVGDPTDFNHQKLVTMFGQDRADRITDVLRNERIGRDTDTAIRLNSQTAARLAAAKALDQQSGKIPSSLSVLGAIGSGANWLKNQIFESQQASQRDRIARYLATTNPAEVQAAARQLLDVQGARTTRNALVRTLAQGGTRGFSAGFVPKRDEDIAYAP